MSRTTEEENNIGRAGGAREWCSAVLPDELHDASAANSDQQ